MTWLYFGFLCAFGEAFKDLFSKRRLRESNGLLAAWAMIAFTAVFIGPLFFMSGVPALGKFFWVALFAHGFIYCASVVLYMVAIKSSELSLTVPMIMFTPVFMLVTSRIIVGEKPGAFGVVGVVLIVLGSYLLNVSGIRLGILAPLRAVVENSGARLMLFVAFVWSITASIEKIGISNSSPFFWGVMDHLLMLACLTPFALRDLTRRKLNIAHELRGFLPAGVFNAVGTLGYYLAMNHGLAVYAISIKRTSVLLVIVIGSFMFKESGLKDRLFGAAIMLTGVLFISLG